MVCGEAWWHAPGVHSGERHVPSVRQPRVDNSVADHCTEEEAEQQGCEEGGDSKPAPGTLDIIDDRVGPCLCRVMVGER